MALIHHPQPTNQTEGNWFSIFKKYQNTKMKCLAVFPLQKLEIYIKTFRMRAHNVSEVEGGTSNKSNLEKQFPRHGRLFNFLTWTEQETKLYFFVFQPDANKVVRSGEIPQMKVFLASTELHQRALNTVARQCTWWYLLYIALTFLLLYLQCTKFALIQ